METILCHYWVRSADGHSTRYEVAYYSYPIRDGVQCHAKVPSSEHPCTCQEQEDRKRWLTATLN